MFEAIEGNFSLQAKFSVTLASLSGFYMTYRLDAWDRFSDPRFWWMPAMVLVWAVFTFVLFIAEPVFLHAWFESRARRDPTDLCSGASRPLGPVDAQRYHHCSAHGVSF